jgi:hypothetical protein
MALRPSRREVMTGALAAGLAPSLVGEAQAGLMRPLPIVIRATPIRAFSPREPEQKRFGALQFRGGLQLTSRHDDFGGWSGLWRSADGRQLVAVSDKASWLTASVVTQGSVPIGLEDGTIAPILGADGRPLWRTKSYDTEGLSIVDGIAHVCIERTHEIMRFNWAREGVLARGRSLPMPKELKKLPSNRSLEAIGIVPSGLPASGGIIAIAERSGTMEEPTLGIIVGGPMPGLLQVRRSKGFDITDLAFLPDGDMMVLERWYAPWRGVGMRIRRIHGRDIKPGAILDGETLIEADLGHEIDNMEGLSVHRENNRTILTLISDDNFSAIQRTILLEFELV